MNELILAAALLLASTITVIDGDTVRANDQTYRLVGFDTPESGDRAQCQSERMLAARATARLQQIIAAGKIRLERVNCACRPGTEGTSSCNYGRLCAVLTADGHDVGELLISEGLAHQVRLRQHGMSAETTVVLKQTSTLRRANPHCNFPHFLVCHQQDDCDGRAERQDHLAGTSALPSTYHGHDASLMAAWTPGD